MRWSPAAALYHLCPLAAQVGKATRKVSATETNLEDSNDGDTLGGGGLEQFASRFPMADETTSANTLSGHSGGRSPKRVSLGHHGGAGRAALVLEAAEKDVFPHPSQLPEDACMSWLMSLSSICKAGHSTWAPVVTSLFSNADLFVPASVRTHQCVHTASS